MKLYEDGGEIYTDEPMTVSPLWRFPRCPVCGETTMVEVSGSVIETEDGRAWGILGLEVISDGHNQTEYVKLACGHLVPVHDPYNVPDFQDMRGEQGVD